MKKLRASIRELWDASLHDLCWHQPKLRGLLPKKSGVHIQVPTREKAMKGCEIFRDAIDAQLPDAPRVEVEFEG